MIEIVAGGYRMDSARLARLREVRKQERYIAAATRESFRAAVGERRAALRSEAVVPPAPVSDGYAAVAFEHASASLGIAHGAARAERHEIGQEAAAEAASWREGRARAEMRQACADYDRVVHGAVDRASRAAASGRREHVARVEAARSAAAVASARSDDARRHEDEQRQAAAAAERAAAAQPPPPSAQARAGFETTRTHCCAAPPSRPARPQAPPAPAAVPPPPPAQQPVARRGAGLLAGGGAVEVIQENALIYTDRGGGSQRQSGAARATAQRHASVAPSRGAGGARVRYENDGPTATELGREAERRRQQLAAEARLARGKAEARRVARGEEATSRLRADAAAECVRQELAALQSAERAHKAARAALPRPPPPPLWDAAPARSAPRKAATSMGSVLCSAAAAAAEASRPHLAGQPHLAGRPPLSAAAAAGAVEGGAEAAREQHPQPCRRCWTAGQPSCGADTEERLASGDAPRRGEEARQGEEAGRGDEAGRGEEARGAEWAAAWEVPRPARSARSGAELLGAGCGAEEGGPLPARESRLAFLERQRRADTAPRSSPPRRTAQASAGARGQSSSSHGAGAAAAAAATAAEGEAAAPAPAAAPAAPPCGESDEAVAALHRLGWFVAEGCTEGLQAPERGAPPPDPALAGDGDACARRGEDKENPRAKMLNLLAAALPKADGDAEERGGDVASRERVPEQPPAGRPWLQPRAASAPGRQRQHRSASPPSAREQRHGAERPAGRQPHATMGPPPARKPPARKPPARKPPARKPADGERQRPEARGREAARGGAPAPSSRPRAPARRQLAGSPLEEEDSAGEREAATLTAAPVPRSEESPHPSRLELAAARAASVPPPARSRVGVASAAALPPPSAARTASGAAEALWEPRRAPEEGPLPGQGGCLPGPAPSRRDASCGPPPRPAAVDAAAARTLLLSRTKLHPHRRAVRNRRRRARTRLGAAMVAGEAAHSPQQPPPRRRRWRGLRTRGSRLGRAAARRAALGATLSPLASPPRPTRLARSPSRPPSPRPTACPPAEAARRRSIRSRAPARGASPEGDEQASRRPLGLVGRSVPQRPPRGAAPFEAAPLPHVLESRRDACTSAIAAP